MFTTGKIPPKVENAIFDIVDDNVIIQHKITDVNSLASFGTINYNGGIDFIDDFHWSKQASPFLSLRI